MSTSSIFDKFTSRYALSKTLRFELKPVGKTSESLKSVFVEDKIIDQNYKTIKLRLDELHRQFVIESLHKSCVTNINLADYAKAYIDLLRVAKKEQSKEQKTACVRLRKNILNDIVALFDSMGNEWKQNYEQKTSTGRSGKQKQIKFSSTGYKILTDEAVLNILIDIHKNNPDDVKMFEKFFGFFTYFGKFNQTRENLYKADGTSTAIATRVIENFEKFLRNKHIVETEYLSQLKEIGITDEEVSALTDIEKYKACFLQSGIDAYNSVLEGESEIDQSVNKKVNEYRQKTWKKVNFLAKLHNQILSEKEVTEMLVIESDSQLRDRLQVFVTENDRYFARMVNLISSLLLREGQSGFDYSKVYLSGMAINTISSKYFLNWSVLKGSLLGDTGVVDGQGGSEQLPDFVSLEHVQEVLNAKNDIDSKELFKKEILEHKAFVVGKSNFENLSNVLVCDLNIKVHESSVALSELMKDSFWGTGVLSHKRKTKHDEGSIQIGLITSYLNACRDAHRMIKYFATEDKKEWVEPETGVDPRFYDTYRKEYEKDQFFPLYNATRNFLTQKPVDENKIKLNFESGSLLSGWDKNKEQEKLGIILRRDGRYYLAIMRKEFSDMFDEHKHPEAYRAAQQSYAKMVYKLFPDPKRMIPKVAFAESNKDEFGWTPEIQAIKDEYATFQESKKEDQAMWKVQFDKAKTTKLIAYYQQCLVKGGYKDTFGLTWKKPEEYTGIGDFNDDIARQNYKVKFVTVDAAYIDERVERGELYLFQINSKDFSSHSTGAKNIHSMYFLQLFSEENLTRTPTTIQLAGAGEIFYREASVDSESEQRNFPREITKFKRFTQPKLFFHVSIKINAGEDPIRSQYQFNRVLNTELIKEYANDLCVIGIDRGEKNLAYYSVINSRGKIIDEGSFNTINTANTTNGIPYHRLLSERERERVENRQSWLPARQIKDLKKGFVGHAVKEICDLVVKHNAIVVLEDLNMRFKQIRSGIEKSAYQQLEKALIDKLGYLVFKNNNDQEPGGVLSGYQLAAPFESFADMGKQTGIVFYTEASYTSTTDPVTGFRKNVYISNAATQETIMQFIERCDAIGWSDKYKSYYITYNPINFADKKNKNKTHSRLWTVVADVPRIRRERDAGGQWSSKFVNPNDLLKQIFETWGFVGQESGMKQQILEKHKAGELKGKRPVAGVGEERTFFNAFIYAFNQILQLRNSDTESSKDFIASPVEPFFTTLDAPDARPCGIDLKNGDSLGAYNIARKGLMTIARIVHNPEKPDLYISKEQWDEFVEKQFTNK